MFTPGLDQGQATRYPGKQHHCVLAIMLRPLIRLVPKDHENLFFSLAQEP